MYNPSSRSANNELRYCLLFVHRSKKCWWMSVFSGSPRASQKRVPGHWAPWAQLWVWMLTGHLISAAPRLSATATGLPDWSLSSSAAPGLFRHTPTHKRMSIAWLWIMHPWLHCCRFREDICTITNNSLQMVQNFILKKLKILKWHQPPKQFFISCKPFFVALRFY